ncbi:hypothetical protein E4U43_008681, partial [Claviceps pusilla]
MNHFICEDGGNATPSDYPTAPRQSIRSKVKIHWTARAILLLSTKNQFTRRVRGTSHLSDFAQFPKRPGTARVVELLPPRGKTPRTAASAFGNPEARLADI